MEMLKDMMNGLGVLFKFGCLAVMYSVCMLGALYLPLALLGINKCDNPLKLALCAFGVYGIGYIIAYIGRRD